MAFDGYGDGLEQLELETSGIASVEPEEYDYVSDADRGNLQVVIRNHPSSNGTQRFIQIRNCLQCRGVQEDDQSGQYDAC